MLQVLAIIVAIVAFTVATLGVLVALSLQVTHLKIEPLQERDDDVKRFHEPKDYWADDEDLMQ